MGLESRRRYRWTRGRIGDYWDEVFTPDGLERHAAWTISPPHRPGRQPVGPDRNVLGTITADQDAIIVAVPAARSSWTAAPGRTVVALHHGLSADYPA